MSVKQLMSAEEMCELPERPGMGCEQIDGQLHEVSGAAALQGLIAALILRLMDDFVRQHDLGLVFPDGVAYVLDRDPDQVRIPDVSFVAWSDVPGDGVPEWFWEGPPTLAVEVISPNDRAVDIHRKVRDYLNAGVHLVWVLWPQQASVTVYDHGTQRKLDADDHLGGGDALPGFTVRVGDLFEVRRRR